MTTLTTHDLNEIKRRMQGSINALKTELSGLRTGRASAHILDPVNVDAYGASMPLNQVATVSIPAAEVAKEVAAATAAEAAVATPEGEAKPGEKTEAKPAGAAAGKPAAGAAAGKPAAGAKPAAAAAAKPAAKPAGKGGKG